MDYTRGLQTLKECFAEAPKELRAELAALEVRFSKNERAERIFGSSENTRNERAQIVYALNEMALEHCGASFNDLCQGAQPTRRPALEDASLAEAPPTSSPPPPAPSPRLVVPFQVQLSMRGKQRFEVRALQTPGGEPPPSVNRLPYTEDELTIVLRALHLPEYYEQAFRPEQRDLLRDLGLLLADVFAPNLHERVGQALYDALITGQTEIAFEIAMAQAREKQGAVALQLRFDEDAVELATYPWELLHHRRALLLNRTVELTRYISYPEAATALSVTPPLRMLYVESRPIDLQKLPTQTEQQTVREALAELQTDGSIEIITPPKATYREMLRTLENKTVHLLHFDGHGAFGRQCLRCKWVNSFHLTQCQARINGKVCGQDLSASELQGYLAFEDKAKRTHWLSGKQLGALLFGRPVRLAVLSACRSGGVGGESLFRGTAPALIQAGVPAVLSMQLPLSPDGAAAFLQGFYRALARLESLPAAANAGRQWMLDTPEWFIPTLYLRSHDDEGHLFKPTEEL